MTENKVVLITGAARNIGLAIAKRLQKKAMMFVLQAGTSNLPIKQHLKFKMNFQKLPQ